MKNLFILRYCYIFYSFVFMIYIVTILINSKNLSYILGLLVGLMLLVSFPGASRLFKILGSSFLVIGGILFATTDYSLFDIPILLTSNMSLLLLLAMLPWMNSVVRSGRFDQSIKSLMKKNASNLGKLYARSSITTLLLGAFLNLSAAAISQDILKDNLKNFDGKLRDKFISTATLRGYSLSLLWSPLEMLLAVTIFTTGVHYVSLLPYLILISIITFLLDAAWGRYYFGKYRYEDSSENVKQKQELDGRSLAKKIVHLLVALSIFLSLVIILGNLLDMDFILTVTLLIFPFALTWSLIIKRVRSFWIIGWKTWKTKTNNMQNFIVLFVSLSFFSNSINSTEYLNVIQEPILLFSEYPLIIFTIILVIFIFLSLFGIHPIATIGLLTGIITPLMEVINPLSIAIVMVTSAVATLTVGTYGLVVTLTSMNTGQNPYRITLNNILFALTLGGVGILFAYILL